MNIGLTGGTGFIGQCLLKTFAGEHRFTVLCIEEDTDAFFSHPNVRYLHSDFSVDSICRAFADCDAIAHLAGLLSTKEREQWLLSYEPNITLPEKLFIAAQQIGISEIVNISSRTVYDQKGPSPHRESELPRPLNAYAVAKLAVEHLADLYHDRQGLNIRTLRFAQVFGAGGRNGYMMEVFRENCEKQLPLTVFDRQGKELLYVRDAAAAVMKACSSAGRHGIYNIGTGVFHTNLEIAECFCRVYENPAGVQFSGDPDEETSPCFMDVSKAARDLGFRAGYDLEADLRDMRTGPDARQE